MNRRAALAPLLLAVAVALGCPRPDPDEAAVLAACEERAEAIRTLDPARYEPLVSSNYHSGETDRAAVVARFKRLAERGKPVLYEVLERRVEMKGGLATVHERYRLRFETPKGPKEVEDASRLILAREDGRWRFVAGL